MKSLVSRASIGLIAFGILYYFLHIGFQFSAMKGASKPKQKRDMIPENASFEEQLNCVFWLDVYHPPLYQKKPVEPKLSKLFPLFPLGKIPGAFRAAMVPNGLFCKGGKVYGELNRTYFFKRFLNSLI